MAKSKKDQGRELGVSGWGGGVDSHPARERLGVSCARKIHTRVISGGGPSAILAWVDAAETR